MPLFRECEVLDAPRRTAAELHDLLNDLYQRQRAVCRDNAYLAAHGSRRAVENQVRTFQWYRDYVRTDGTVLDWGCNHAPDACLLRAWFGEALTLHSCDFGESDRFEVFFDFAQGTYSRLRDEVRLPYSDNLFDVVVGSGVLEHVPMDYESLKELRRVLKPDGILVISYLPNRWSVNEWYRRNVRKTDFHRRLYGMREAKQLCKRSGFYPIEARYHTFIWERLRSAVGLSGSHEPALVSALLAPLYAFASTLSLVCRKVEMM